MKNLIVYAIPFFIVSMIVEYALWRRRRNGRGWSGKDTAASLSMGLGNLVLTVLTRFLSFGLLVVLYEYRVFDIPNAWWAWVLLIFAEDFCYYWFHRGHHELRVLWAAHVNHHSSRHYNLSTALRQSWTTPLTGPLFWVPLPLIGFAPEMIIVAKTVSLIYQYWLHTEHIRTLGPLEWVMNTPSHHRVHHGRNPRYLDKNYAGIFIIYDRLFGTFEPEVEPVDYGITKNLESHNPWHVAWHEWIAMARDMVRSRSLGTALRIALKSPSWQPAAQRPVDVAEPVAAE